MDVQPMTTSQRVTRLAPSPTGALHLGNARTFLVNYLLARREGWRIIMRMEDLDGPRVKAGAVDEALEDLRWLGLTWDSRVTDQSQRAEEYATALWLLMEMGRAYPCTCSRMDVRRAASAPHREDGLVIYPGTCRGRWRDEKHAAEGAGRSPAIRVRVGDAVMEFADRVAGCQQFALAETCGDFVVRKADGVAGYQLAVVLDDAAAGITDVVRGDDLLESTARQMLLAELLNLSPAPRYWHLPLVVGPDGHRLAKRHGDTRLSYFRDRGVAVQRILGLLGYWSGISSVRRPMDIDELLVGFDIERVGAEPVVFSADDEGFLLGD